MTIQKQIKEILDYHEAKFGTCGGSASSEEVRKSCISVLVSLFTEEVEKSKSRKKK